MLVNFLTSSWRNLKSNWGITLLNVLGLSTGITVFLFILSYCQLEWSYDTFHRDANRIYRLNLALDSEGAEPYSGAAVFPGVGPAFQDELEEVEDFCRVVPIWGYGGVIQYEENFFEQRYIHYVDEHFFTFFSFDLLEGNPEYALKELHTLVISKSLSEKLFGDANALGKQVKVRSRDGEEDYEVTGVYDDGVATHLKADVLLSYPSLVHLEVVGQEAWTNWVWFDYITYIKVQPNTDANLLQAKFAPLIDKYRGSKERGSNRMAFQLQPLQDIHLYSNINQEIAPNGDGRVTNFLMIIGVFVLIIAWINYINLYTAKATERAKEVGVRKTLGARKSSLITQFFVEAALMNLLSVAAALVLLVVLTPVLLRLTENELPIFSLTTYQFWLSILMLWSISTVSSGLYPALIIARFNPLKALKQKGNQSGSGRLRKTLVAFQFLATSLLLGGTAVVYQQLSFMNQQALGVDTAQVVVIETPNYSGDHDAYVRSLKLFKESLNTRSAVIGVSYSSEVISEQVGWRGSSYYLKGHDEQAERKIVFKMNVDEQYLDFYDVDFLAGRNYQQPADSQYVIINQAALALYDIAQPDDALGEMIFVTGADTLAILGVVGNYYQESLKEGFKPTVYLYMDEEIAKLSVRLASNSIEEFISYAQQQFQTYFPNMPFDYAVLDDLLAQRHRNEKQFLSLFNLFALIAIIIALLGLLGLTHYMAIKRQKEMGIRKVLGSSVDQIVTLVFQDFAKLVLIGNLLAIPLLYWTAGEWLNQFAFKISFNWLIPILSLVISLVCALAFSLVNLRKLGRVNPAEVLN